jgi:hypothetical protein
MKKNLSEFCKDIHMKNGKKSNCKSCCSKSSKKWREKNPTKVKIINDNHNNRAKVDAIVKLKKVYAGAREFERDYELTYEQGEALLLADCRYCGVSRSWGIDRIDSSKGYIEGNVAPCCGKCNKMKLNYTLDEFKSQIVKIYKHLNLNESK